MKVWTVLACVAVAAMGVDAAETCVANCTEIYKPVCGSDGKTYENQCAFDYKKCSSKDEKLTVVAEGECKASSTSGSAAGGGGIVGSNCEKGCPKIRMPVCGSDGKTYSNECELNNGKCANPKLTLASKGECGGGSASGSGGTGCGTTMCPMDYTPVCGSDGKTYSNECKLETEKCTNPSLTMVSVGECGGRSKMGSAGGEASKDNAVSPTPSTQVPTPAPTSDATAMMAQVATSLVVSAVAAVLL